MMQNLPWQKLKKYGMLVMVKGLYVMKSLLESLTIMKIVFGMLEAH